MYIKNPFNKKNQMEQVDTASGILLSLAVLFGGAAGGFFQTNFWISSVCAVIAIVAVITREFVKG